MTSWHSDYWPFVREIHWSPVVSLHKRLVIRGFVIFYEQAVEQQESPVICDPVTLMWHQRNGSFSTPPKATTAILLIRCFLKERGKMVYYEEIKILPVNDPGTRASTGTWLPNINQRIREGPAIPTFVPPYSKLSANINPKENITIGRTMTNWRTDQSINSTWRLKHRICRKIRWN